MLMTGSGPGKSSMQAKDNAGMIGRTPRQKRYQAATDGPVWLLRLTEQALLWLFHEAVTYYQQDWRIDPSP